MYVIAYIALIMCIVFLLFVINSLKEQRYSLVRHIKFINSAKDFHYNNFLEYQSYYEKSQDKLATIQTAFMEYKKEWGQYNEKDFEVYL